MRQIVLDTETTGLDPEQGHRIIEIGCVEIVNRRVTDKRYQQFINPEREIDTGATNVHGITSDDLQGKPVFADIAEEFVTFVRGSELVIHNAPFDVGFLDAELERLGRAWGQTTDYCTVFDTLKLAREVHPGQRNALDPLCRRYEIDITHRDLHGALLDAELLAEVYLAMTGGQGALELDSAHRSADEHRTGSQRGDTKRKLVVVAPTSDEFDAHQHQLGLIDEASGNCLWLHEDMGDPVSR